MLTGTARLLKDRDPLIGGQSAVQGQGGEPKQRSGVSPGQSIGISGRNQPVRAPWAELIPSLPRLFMLLRPPARPTLAAWFVWPCLPTPPGSARCRMARKLECVQPGHACIGS